MDPALNVLAKRGDEHETAYVEYLKNQGLKVEVVKSQSLPLILLLRKRPSRKSRGR